MRILIADDDLGSIELLEWVLGDWGYEVVTARNGTEAWEVLRRDDSPPLAILDWMMPGLDGIEVCRKVRKEVEAPYVYLILLTGKAGTKDIVRGMESGADDYVSKPFEEEELKVRLRAGRRIVELQEALRTHACRDSLTGAWNRRMILEMLHRESARSGREGTPLGVIMADLDHFKRLNDTHGHAAGDDALREASRRMGTALRPYDGLGRYGGEEFLIVLPGCDLPGALMAAERVRLAIAEGTAATPPGMPPFTISLGVAASAAADCEPDALIQMADEALHRAKRAGRNRVAAAAGLGIPAPSDR